MRKKLCWSTWALAFPIHLFQTGRNKFMVVYGKDVSRDLTYNQACVKLGSAMMHALSCDGKVDNREPGEK